MEVGAFEYTPPRMSASERHLTQPQGELTTHRETPSTPEIPAFATVQSAIASAPSGTRVTIPKSPSSVSKRKRQQMGLSSPARPSSPSERPVLSFGSPSLRRKYSTAGKPPPAPTPSQPLQSRVSYTNKSATPVVLQSDEPMTPPLDLTSPLLRTQLRAMTPHTPLSNRLVGANFDIGSAEQESKLSAYDESFTSGGPAPEFELSLFPLAFQVKSLVFPPRRCQVISRIHVPFLQLQLHSVESEPFKYRPCTVNSRATISPSLRS